MSIRSHVIGYWLTLRGRAEDLGFDWLRSFCDDSFYAAIANPEYDPPPYDWSKHLAERRSKYYIFDRMDFPLRTERIERELAYDYRIVAPDLGVFINNIVVDQVFDPVLRPVIDSEPFRIIQYRGIATGTLSAITLENLKAAIGLGTITTSTTSRRRPKRRSRSISPWPTSPPPRGYHGSGDYR